MSAAPSLIEIPAILIDAAGGSIHGKTVLQKLGYFLGVEEQSDLGFVPHYYGPFSRKLEYAVEVLTFSGDVKETTTQLGVNRDGWPVRETTYELTEQGRGFAAAAAQDHARTAKRASELFKGLIEWDSSISPKPLSLAAKVHFLCQRRGVAPNVADLERSARKVGWDLEERDIRSALDLLRHLGLASD